MGGPASSISPSASAREFLAWGLAHLRDIATLGLLHDPDGIDAIVTCCEISSVEDASDILHNILCSGGEAANPIIGEYLRRRLLPIKPNRVNDSKEEPSKMYRNPDLSEYSDRKRKRDGENFEDAARKNELGIHPGLSSGSEFTRPAGLELSEGDVEANVFKDRRLEHDHSRPWQHQRFYPDIEGNEVSAACKGNAHQSNVSPESLGVKDEFLSLQCAQQIQSACARAPERANVFSGMVQHDRQLAEYNEPLSQSIFTPVEDEVPRVQNDKQLENYFVPLPQRGFTLAEDEMTMVQHDKQLDHYFEPLPQRGFTPAEDEMTIVPHDKQLDHYFEPLSQSGFTAVEDEMPSVQHDKQLAHYLDPLLPRGFTQVKDEMPTVQHEKQLAHYFQPLSPRGLAPVGDEMPRRSSPNTWSLAGRTDLPKGFTPISEGCSRQLPLYYEPSAGMAGLHRGFSAVADERSGHLAHQTGKQIYHEASSSAFDICMPTNKAKPKDKPIKLFPYQPVQKRERDLDYKQKFHVVQYLMPGIVFLKNWLSRNDQVYLVRTCRTLGLGPGGFYQPSYDNNNTMHLWMMCLGKNWDPVSKSYEDIRSYDNAVPPPLPPEFVALAKRAVAASQDGIRKDTMFMTTEIQRTLPSMDPDICLVNFYKDTGELGMQQEKDESGSNIYRGLPIVSSNIQRGLPAVSFIVGDSAEFVYGIDRGMDRANRLILESGDVLIFDAPSSPIYHGITRVFPHTSPRWLTEETNLSPGSINLTFRQL